MVCRLIVVVDDHKTDTAEEQNAVESTYPASPLVVFAKICGGYDFLEERALHKFLHEDGSLPRFLVLIEFGETSCDVNHIDIA